MGGRTKETRGGRTECSGWVVGFEHSLKVGRGCSSCCSIGKYHGLVVDASFDWKFWISSRGLMAQAGSPANRVAKVQTGDDVPALEPRFYTYTHTCLQ